MNSANLAAEEKEKDRGAISRRRLSRSVRVEDFTIGINNFAIFSLFWFHKGASLVREEGEGREGGVHYVYSCFPTRCVVVLRNLTLPIAI